MMPSITALLVFAAIVGVLLGPLWLGKIILIAVLGVIVTALIDNQISLTLFGSVTLIAIAGGLRSVVILGSETADAARSAGSAITRSRTQMTGNPATEEDRTQQHDTPPDLEEPGDWERIDDFRL